MFEQRPRYTFGLLAANLVCALALVACGGGGTGNATDSGPNITYLHVEAADADGDALHYQWRATAGSIENRDSPETVWTLPSTPGLHFAYVIVSDGKGGYAEQQYAVSSDAIGGTVAPRAAVSRATPGFTTNAWRAGRLRFASGDTLNFAVPGSASAARVVYLPDVQVQIRQAVGNGLVFTGSTDLSGELSLPDLDVGSYVVKCSTVAGQPPGDCGGLLNGIPTPYRIDVAADAVATVRSIAPPLTTARNLHLFGHVAFADGGVCGTESEFFARQSAATVQLLQADGTPTTSPIRVNRFGDYAVDVAALATGRYQLKVVCEGYSATVPVPPSPAPLGYVGAVPIEVTHLIPNARPTITKVVANGSDGNVRGAVPGAPEGISKRLPGPRQFLAYMGQDTRLSACRYYVSIGAAGGCDAQGNMQGAISLDDWKRKHAFKPYNGGNAEVAAVYINRMDLNLVRRMFATQSAPDNIAFVVCNHPGPDGASQVEVDQVLVAGLADEKRVACVAMEWSVSPGVNGGRPFTKFLTFGPDGSLILSINLDGRGEKYMPGACVACHSGTQYNGRFPETGAPSPYLGSGFLPFDTGNYLFGSAAGLSEAAQGQAFHDLNMLVRATDAYASNQSITKLIDGWYPGATTTLDKLYVPIAWQNAEAGNAVDAPKPGLSKLYREVVGGVCRTCHAAMGSNETKFDWDSRVSLIVNNSNTTLHFCGGRADIALNASMPNALTSRDRLADRVAADPQLAGLMQSYLGCVDPLPDPAYPKR